MQAKGIVIGLLFISAARSLGAQSSVPFIHADDVHAQGITGRGITVGVLDQGIDYAHPGLAGSIAQGGVSYIRGVLHLDQGAAPAGVTHGTIMSLIITDATGVAPDAKIFPVRVVDANGRATSDDVRLGIMYTTIWRKYYPGLRVINISLGSSTVWPCPCDWADTKYAAAVSEALLKGIVTFAATGNDGDCDGVSRPACFSDAVKVAEDYDANYGQVTFSGLCTDFSAPYRVTCASNRADFCNNFLAAPGFQITVGGFPPENGTSAATPHCSGVAALMFERNLCGALTADTARQVIVDTATPDYFAYSCAPDPQPSHVNAYAAVNDLRVAGACTTKGDMDCDGTISPYDCQRFAECMTGPDGGLAGYACTCADFPASPPDGDVDLRDFLLFQRGPSPVTAAGPAVMKMPPAPTTSP